MLVSYQPMSDRPNMLSMGVSKEQTRTSISNISSSSSEDRSLPLPTSSSTHVTAPRRVGGKSNVSSACVPCKKAHLACDVSRPCKRCTTLNKGHVCEDIPHKKRGRPRAGPNDLGAPYSMTRLPSYPDTNGQWRAPNYNTPSSFLAPPLSSNSLPSPPLFTCFTTTDFRILRCTPGSTPLTGYQPKDYINTYLLDWVMPHDRPLLEMELGRLMNNPMGPGVLHTNRETQEAMGISAETDLMSPVEGMREPYPNQNVRVMRADQQYSLFNIRLHLGGGLGGSLWHPETSGRVYFVVSLLLLPPPPVSPNPIPIKTEIEPPELDSRRYSSPLIAPQPSAPFPQASLITRYDTYPLPSPTISRLGETFHPYQGQLAVSTKPQVFGNTSYLNTPPAQPSQVYTPTTQTFFDTRLEPYTPEANRSMREQQVEASNNSRPSTGQGATMQGYGDYVKQEFRPGSCEL